MSWGRRDSGENAACQRSPTDAPTEGGARGFSIERTEFGLRKGSRFHLKIKTAAGAAFGRR